MSTSPKNQFAASCSKASKQRTKTMLAFLQACTTHTLAHPGGRANITERSPIKFFQQICVKNTGIRLQKKASICLPEVLFYTLFHYSTRFHCNFFDKSNSKYVPNEVTYEIMVLCFGLT